MAKSGRPTAKRKDTKELGTPPALIPDAQHSYGFDNENIKNQFKELSASDATAELKSEVEQVKARLSALEAVVSEITRKLTVEPEQQATLEKPPAQSSTMSDKEMQDQQNSFQESFQSPEEAAEIARNTIAGGSRNRLKKAR